MKNEGENIYENMSFLEYDPNTLKPILKYEDIIDFYPQNKIGAITAYYKKKKLKNEDVDLKEAAVKINSLWDEIQKEKDPFFETKSRFTRDGRLVDSNNYLAWKLERVPDVYIPIELKKIIRTPIYFTRDDRKNMLQEPASSLGDKYIKNLDIIIMTPWNMDRNGWKTTLAHELAHSILHKNISDDEYKEKYEEIEKAADEFVRKNFASTEWFNEEVLHGGS